MSSTEVKSTLIADDLSGQRGERCLLVGHIALFSTIAGYIKVRLYARDARLGKEFEPLGQGHLTVVVTVIVRTVLLFAICAMLTLFHLQEVRMVFLLFPTMGVRALILIGTTFSVGANEIVHLPAWTHLTGVREHGWATPVVLPIVRIDTHLPIVIVFSVRAPHGLEDEHVKVHINLMLFYKLDRELTLIMRKGTVLLILAGLSILLQI